jgi:chorismate dehydratase
VPYLNSAPFFQGLAWEERYEVIEHTPRVLGEDAAAGGVTAGLLPLVDYFRLSERFERLGSFGIAVRGRAESVLLFCRRPLRQLDGATIAVTQETSTSAVLLRLILEQRYRLSPAAYRRGEDTEADALLLIGDEALRFQRTNTQYPFEVDVAFEWWLWQHLPCVFAVWAVRRDAPARDKRQIESGLARSLAMNLGQLGSLAQERAAVFGIPAADLERYLGNFVYRLGPSEEEAIRRFRALMDEHHLF